MDRLERATELAEAIGTHLRDRTGVEVSLTPNEESPEFFTIMWQGQKAGTVQVLIPKSEYLNQRTRFVLHLLDGSTRSYVKLGSLIEKAATLCRPATSLELEKEQRRTELQEIEAAINRIGGETGSISRYLHIHRMALAFWLARLDPGQEGLPIELRSLVTRMREQVAKYTELMDRKIEAEET